MTLVKRILCMGAKIRIAGIQSLFCLFLPRMKNFSSLSVLLLAVAFFSACSKKCDEPDIQAINALYFELDQSSDGFTPEALDEIFIVRFVPFSEPLLADTVYLDGIYPSGSGRFYINDEFPFVNSQSPYYTIYGYIIVDPTTSYGGVVENISLEGEYDGDCDYDNIAKRFTFNTDTVDMGGTQDFYLVIP
jgi:hypothetical protein